MQTGQSLIHGGDSPRNSAHVFTCPSTAYIDSLHHMVQSARWHVHDLYYKHVVYLCYQNWEIPKARWSTPVKGSFSDRFFQRKRPCSSARATKTIENHLIGGRKRFKNRLLSVGLWSDLCVFFDYWWVFNEAEYVFRGKQEVQLDKKVVFSLICTLYHFVGPL